MRKKKNNKGTIKISKDFFTKLSVEQRMFLHLHEYAHKEGQEQRKNMIVVDAYERHKEYFQNFPFDEKAVRDFLGCLKDNGYFKNSNPMEDRLSDMLEHPDSSYGFRILNVTVGKGNHKAPRSFNRNGYDVNEDEVYVTYNTIYSLAGGIYTCVMKKVDGKNKIVKSYTHAMS